ncbi:MAG: ATP-binding protein, partial [bacterium]
ELRRKNIVRLVLTYLVPLIILIIYFQFQYRSILKERHLAQLKTIAESQSRTIDLFLRERVVNLSNLIDDPKLHIPPTGYIMKDLLSKLKKTSETFVDIDFFDSTGNKLAYEGPYPLLEKKNYSHEKWFTNLRKLPGSFIITDIYLGFRKKPHFTIAVSRIINGNYFVLRTTLDPQKFYEYTSSLEGAREIYTMIINKKGYYQIISPNIGNLLGYSTIIPPKTPRLNADKTNINGKSVIYAYSWLENCDWALIVRRITENEKISISSMYGHVIAFSTMIILLIFTVIVIRAGRIVKNIEEADKTRAQLSDDLLHASKLAAIGELAAGIAHEINNPLAAINEEAGLIKDLINPEYNQKVNVLELAPYLDSIQDSVFRCRDITHKLLKFVRKKEIDLNNHDINSLIQEIVEGLPGNKIKETNINITGNYGTDIPCILTDKNQLQQVILNMLNNSIDAIGESKGSITIQTSLEKNYLVIQIVDTGKGMYNEQLEKIFIPFYTTKGVGKGTGLGLSVSYGIIRSLGGEIDVSSRPGEGSTFTIKLPKLKGA